MGNRKINGPLFDLIDDRVGGLDVGSRRDDYRAGRFPRADKVQDLDRRYRWDLFWMAFQTFPEFKEAFRDTVLNDAHIDTALRAVVPTLGVSK